MESGTVVEDMGYIEKKVKIKGHKHLTDQTNILLL